MTLSDCYNLFGGDYTEVHDRLCKDELIQKYLLRFVELNEFVALRDALNREDYEKADLAAYSIMVSSLHLGFPALHESAEQLRAVIDSRNTDDIEAFAEKTKAEYDVVYNAIQQYAAEM